MRMTNCPFPVNFQLTFDTSYKMDLQKYRNDMAIAVGVLSAFAIVYGAVQTWGWSKRAGKIGIDFVSLMKFIMFTVGNLANVFFVVSFGSSVWWLIFYKVKFRSIYICFKCQFIFHKVSDLPTFPY